jgi:hypothetical protein
MIVRGILGAEMLEKWIASPPSGRRRETGPDSHWKEVEMTDWAERLAPRLRAMTITPRHFRYEIDGGIPERGHDGR